MTFRYTPADEDNRLTEGMVHTDMFSKTTTFEAEETQPEEQVSTVAESISENTADTHIPSVDEQSQLTECEYQRDCISVGKKQADGLSDNFFDSLSLTTTTDRGRDAAVVEVRMSADQSGSPVDWIVLILSANNLPKECCVVASGPDGKIRRNDRLCHPRIDRLLSSHTKSGARYNCRAVGDKHQISSAKMPRLVGPVVGMKSTMISHGNVFARHAQMTGIEQHRGLVNQRSVGLLRRKRFRRRPLVQKYRSFVIPASGIFGQQGVTVSCPA